MKDDLSYARRAPVLSDAKVRRYIQEALVGNVTAAEVIGRGKQIGRIEAVAVRWAVIARLRADRHSLQSIGRALNMDHTSVLYALERVLRGEAPRRGAALRPKKRKPQSPTLVRYVGFDPRERALDWR